MSEKAPDFIPAPSALPEGMYGPDNFSLTTKDKQTGERRLESADERGFHLVDRVDLPTDVQQHFQNYPEDTVFIESAAGDRQGNVAYKASTKEQFDTIQAEADSARQAERAPLFEAAEQAMTAREVAETYATPSEALEAAIDVLDDRLAQADTEFAESFSATTRHLSDDLQGLVEYHDRIVHGAEEILNGLKRGQDNPGYAVQVTNAAIEQLGQLRVMIGRAAENADQGRSKSRKVEELAEQQSITLRQLGNECVGAISQIRDIDPKDDARAREEIGQLVSVRVKAVDRTISAVKEFGGKMNRLSTDDSELGNYPNRLIGRLEEIRQGTRLGRFDSDGYNAVLRYCAQFIDEAGNNSRLAGSCQQILAEL